MKKRFLFFLIWFVIFGSTSWAEPVVTETETYYDIHGSTIEQLYNAMHHGSGRSDGTAFTYWPITTDPQWAETPQGWAITAPKVTLNLKYKFPRWVDEAKASADVRKRWDAYYKAMLVHEHGHGALALEAARAIEHAIMAVPPNKDERLVRWALQTAYQKTMHTYELKEIDYDHKTEYGRKQGATFS